MSNPVFAMPIGSVLRSPYSTYEVLQVLGSGGFGITYLAQSQTTVGNIPVTFKVAIKEHFLRSDCSRDASGTGISYPTSSRQKVEAACRDFVREACNLRSIAGQCENIVRVNEVFEANGTAYYVMEYLGGMSLRDYIRTNGPVTVDRALEIMMPVINAVGVLHSLYINHLDIKPANIMLEKNERGTERPVLIDFGLSRHYNTDGAPTTSIGMTGVTDGFSPIEQYSGITEFSPASDVYSLAATLVYCLTGNTLPPALETNRQSIEAILPASVPAGLRQVLERALSLALVNRQPNASVLAQELAPYAASAATSSTDTTTTSVAGDFTRPVTPAVTPIISDNDRNDTVISTPPPPSSPTPGYGAPSPVEPIRFGGKKKKSGGSAAWIYVLIGLLVAAVAGIVVYMLVSSGGKTVVRDDDDFEFTDESWEEQTSSPAMTDNSNRPVEATEVVEVEEVAPESTYSSLQGDYDFLFQQLKPGTHVKSLKWSGNVFTFAPNGEWTNPYYEDSLTDRDWNISNSRRTSEYYTYNGDRGVMEYYWNGDNISSIVDNTRGFTVYRYYNSDGTLSSSVTSYHDGRPSKEYTYTNYKFDSNGNWTSRKVNGNTESRTITYY
ncbi:MAG: serine/threonine protein kinase [Bacteroides sp.]|nr:serine/threonine protein kinase [Bacteroides sp.]MCM1413985.1 serine/threonine protein kinase [Bacteroides sp.]MCM1471798.1 serine/threonine protein kinase [Bacteroides sp.]